MAMAKASLALPWAMSSRVSRILIRRGSASSRRTLKISRSLFWASTVAVDFRNASSPANAALVMSSWAALVFPSWIWSLA